MTTAANVVFSHPNPTVGTLNLRLPPSQVEWSFSINTSATNTYGGQVVQLLSISFDSLTISGQFGWEGPHGRLRTSDGFVERPQGDWENYSNQNLYAIGLTQLTSYFRNYFAVASSGAHGDDQARGVYNQQPMTLSYTSALNVNVDFNTAETWSVYPTSMPSYRRANDAFAPEWQVACEVYQAPSNIYQTVSQDTLARINSLKENTGYTPSNIFSDPNGTVTPINAANVKVTPAMITAAQNVTNNEVQGFISTFKSQLPSYSVDDLASLLNIGASTPTSSYLKVGPTVGIPTGGAPSAVTNSGG